MSALRPFGSLLVYFFSSRDDQSSFSGNVAMNQQPSREEAFPARVVCAAPDSASILHKRVTAGRQKRQLPDSTKSFTSSDTRGVLVVPGASC